MIVTRRKKKKGRKAELTKDLEEETIIHSLNDEEKACDCCGCQMESIGTTVIRENVEFIPAKVVKKVHKQESYACRNCHENTVEATPIKSAPVPAAPIQNSLAGATVLAWLYHQKFELHLPLYRQVGEWLLYGLDVSRRTLANWVIVSAHDWLQPIYELLYLHLMKMSILHADETPWQIINRSDGKPGTSEARIWQIRTTPTENRPVIYYHSALTRSGDVAKELFKTFSGYLQTDGYQTYQNLLDIIQVGCWVHVNRKFKDVGVNFGKAGIAIKKINAIFKKDHEFDDLSPNERLKRRQKELKPLIEEFFDWLETFTPVPKSNLAKAVEYAKNQKATLIRVLDDGRLLLSNNCCEQLIRPLALGRKNHLFSTSEKGATANAIAYTIIYTARENGLNPYKYLVYLFTHLPNTDFYRNPHLLEAFLPWHPYIQNICS